MQKAAPAPIATKVSILGALFKKRLLKSTNKELLINYKNSNSKKAFELIP